jgi:hypothetical protein
MITQTTLLLTKYPVYDMHSPVDSGLRFTGLLLRNLKIIAEITAPAETTREDFTKGAISWAKNKFKDLDHSIDIVSGDAAYEPEVTKAGLKYSSDPKLRELPR